jgi:precorrin-3B synthase
VLHLDAVAADLRLTAVQGGWLVAVGGTAATARAVGRFDAEGAVRAGLEVLAELSARRVRGRELELPEGGGSARKVASAVGGFVLRDGLARGVAPAFGLVESAALAGLAEAAEAGELRPAAGRAIVALGLSAEGDRRLLAAAERLGFVTRADDPRLSVVACAGAPACGSGLIATRRLAPRLAELAPEGVRLHLSGCAKRCAQPEGPAVTVLGTPEGAVVTGEGIEVSEALRKRLLAEARG